MAHTLGPWSVLADTNQIWCADYPVAEVTWGKWGDDYPSIRLVGPSLQLKAEPYMDRIEYGEIFEDTARANARLIAAAPDLLAALKANMEWIGRPPVDRHSYDSKREDAWAMGKQAIADVEKGDNNG